MIPQTRLLICFDPGAVYRPPIARQSLLVRVNSVFAVLSSHWTLVEDSTASGVFLRCAIAASGSYVEIPLGRIAGLRRFTSGFRVSPFWMKPSVGADESQVKSETQWLLGECDDGQCVLVVPLLDGPARFSLKGSSDGLVVVGETGDPQISVPGGVAVFVACGEDPYELLTRSARAVSTRLGTGRLRAEKSVPDFVDLFGWCTWDAFYKEVSAARVREGLSSFRDGGVEPRLLVLDDGWQSVQAAATGEERLISLAANDRFAGELTPTVRLAKDEFKVRRFLVWHALLGYWGGLDEALLAAYEPRTVARSFGPGILERSAHWNVRPWGAVVGVPGASRVAAFFDDYHRVLREQGVDGVKVDNQAMLEAVSAGQGGRVALARVFRQALERSVTRHFSGRLINCMSCTTEAAYLAADSTVMRMSDDFYPQKPEMQGAHLFVNAHAGLWFGEFMLPDWDMFQSSHTAAAMHAAARAISGGPVYVSDKPGSHDFDLLRKLVLSDGSVLRCGQPGRPTRDVLFADPRVEPVLLKIFNRTGDCGVVGLFNVQYHADPTERRTICSEARPADVVGLHGETFVGFAHRANRVWRCARDEPADFALAETEWELVSYAPVEHGFAALGLADKLNSCGAITSRTWDGSRICRLTLRDGGSFIGWAAREPSAVRCDGVDVSHQYDAGSGRLTIDVPTGGVREVAIEWQVPV